MAVLLILVIFAHGLHPKGLFCKKMMQKITSKDSLNESEEKI